MIVHHLGAPVALRFQHLKPLQHGLMHHRGFARFGGPQLEGSNLGTPRTADAHATFHAYGIFYASFLDRNWTERPCGRWEWISSCFHDHLLLLLFVWPSPTGLGLLDDLLVLVITYCRLLFAKVGVCEYSGTPSANTPTPQIPKVDNSATIRIYDFTTMRVCCNINSQQLHSFTYDHNVFFGSASRLKQLFPIFCFSVFLFLWSHVQVGWATRSLYPRIQYRIYCSTLASSRRSAIPY